MVAFSDADFARATRSSCAINSSINSSLSALNLSKRFAIRARPECVAARAAVLMFQAAREGDHQVAAASRSEASLREIELARDVLG